MSTFDIKHPSSTEWFTLDFARQLPAGVTIASAGTTVATVLEGTDGTPGAIISGAATFNGTAVSQKIVAGQPGVHYQLAFSCVTSDGQTLVEYGDFWVDLAGQAAYTTLQNVKEFLGLEGDGDNAVLIRLIKACTQAIDTILSRTIAQSSYTDKFDGKSGDAWGATHLYPKNYPLISVTILTIDSTTIPPSSDGKAYGWILAEDLVELVGGCATTQGLGNVSLSYTAGFATTPSDIESVCIQLVAQRYRERARLGISSESDGRGMTRSYDHEMPPWCEKILNQYADVVPR